MKLKFELSNEEKIALLKTVTTLGWGEHIEKVFDREVKDDGIVRAEYSGLGSIYGLKFSLIFNSEAVIEVLERIMEKKDTVLKLIGAYKVVLESAMSLGEVFNGLGKKYRKAA